MNLKVYTPATTDPDVKLAHKRPPYLTVYSGGTFRINFSLADLLGLKEGHTVSLAEDQQYKGDWYIIKSAGYTGFPLKKSVKWFTFHNLHLSRLVLSSLDEVSRLMASGKRCVRFKCTPCTETGMARLDVKHPIIK